MKVPPGGGRHSGRLRAWPGLCGGTRPTSVRACLLLLVLWCAVPATLVASLLIVLAYRDGRAVLTERAAATSRLAMGAVDEEIRDAIAALQVLATSPPLEQDDLAAFHAQALRVLPLQPGRHVVLSDLGGRQLVNTLVPFGLSLPPHGQPRLQRAVLDDGKAAVSDLVVDSLQHRPEVTVEVPVVVGGHVLYTLAMGLRPDRFADVLARVQPASDWVVTVIDRTGTVIARTHQGSRFVGQKVVPGLMAAMSSEAQGVVETDTLEGIPVLAAYTRSPVHGWTVAVGVPRQILLSRLQQWVAALALGSAAVLGLAVAMAWWISRRIAGAVESLIAPAEALGHGAPVDVAPLPLKEAQAVALALGRASALLQARTQERDQAARETANARELARRMEHSALHDPLTQLPNRAHFQQRLIERVQACRREGGRLAVFYIDLDDFKPVNDGHGHQMGDLLLRHFAARLLAGVRGSDEVARIGGDEFAVLLDGLSAREAQSIAQALCERLSKPYVIDRTTLHVTACIGVAGCPEDGVTADALLQAADAAMYRAKAAGKGRPATSGFADL